MHISLRYGWAILVALTLVFATTLSRADEVVTGTGLVCDDPDHIKEFVAADQGDHAATLQTVNAAHPNSCGIFTVAFVQGDEVAKVQTPKGIAVIVRIAVVAINLGMGWIRGSAPLTQYTLFLVEGRDA